MEHDTPQARGERMLREGGYVPHKHGDIHADGKKHRGGRAHGHDEKHRPDRRARGGHVSEADDDKTAKWPNDAQGNIALPHGSARANGGSVGKHKGKVTININAAQKGDPQREQMAHQAGLQKGLAMGRNMPRPAAPGGAPPAAPMAPPMAPPGGAPMMAGPPRPPMAAGPMPGAAGPMGARPPGMP